MTKLNFYIQARADGGRRSGIEVDGETLHSHFEPGCGEPDPSLLWYIDIRCKVDSLPRDEYATTKWLIDHSDLFREELLVLSERLYAGLDVDLWPLQHRIVKAPAGVEAVIVCSSIRGIIAREYGSILADVVQNFDSILRSVTALETAAT